MKIELLLAALAVVGSGAFGEIRPIEVKGAPFALTVNEWTPPARDFTIVDFGAKADGRPVTAAIEKAVAAAAAAGGGRVVVPPGEWLTGGFDLKSDVALVVPDGATLRFPDDPVVVYRASLRENGRPQATREGLIQAIGCTNVAILGAGTLKADTDYWHRNFMMNPKNGFPRPNFFTIRNCRNVRFDGFKVRGSPQWTMHFTVCEDIIVRNVDSVCTGPNTDGLDLESCNRALVEGVSLDQTDDTYTIKSGFNETGRKRNIPTQNVVIRNCRAVHGHSMLGIGSEVSGGVRNIYMTDCTIEFECWNWLFVKTNAKRGAFVENVTMENVRGRRANKAVMNVEMFYDGNPNKELGKKVSNEFVTAISGITARNIVCEEACYGVKVRGDASKPPKGLKAENIRIGRLYPGRTSLTDIKDATDVEICDVRVDPSVVREICDLPDAVRPYDPSRDGVGAPCFDLAVFDDMSDNAVLGRVLRARIDAETRTGRTVVPRIEPIDASLLPQGFDSNHRKDLCLGLAALGCAIPGALVADDVRIVAEAGSDGTSSAFPELKLTVSPDLAHDTVTVTLANGGLCELRDLWGVLHLPLHHMTRRQTFRAASVPAGGRFVRKFEIGAGAHYLPRPVGTSTYAVEADFTADGTRARLWSAAGVAVEPKIVFPVSAALCAGPMDAEGADDATLEALSAVRGSLEALDGAAWRSPAFEGAAWYDVTGPSRPYTESERCLVLAGRAVEVVALQFEAPEFAKAMLRLLPYLWDRKTAVFLNGERIKAVSMVTDLPAKVGLNRLVVRFASKPGARKACAQLAVYSWGLTDQLNCVPMEGNTRIDSRRKRKTNR